MMGHLVVRNLFHRPVRTLIGVAAVAVEVMLVVVIVGLTSGMLEETAKRIEGIGADIMLQSPSAQIFLAFSGSPMPIKIADKLREMKYVKAVAPALLQFNSSGSIDILYGIDRDSFRAVSGGLVFLQGHDMEGPDDLLVDDWAAKAKHLKVGDTYTLLNHRWNVVGIVEHGKGARLFVPISTLQDLVGAHDKASIFLVKCTRPEHTADVINEMKATFPGYPVRPLKDFMTLMTSTNIPALRTFINAMVALAVSIGLLVIFLTMYTTVLERTNAVHIGNCGRDWAKLHRARDVSGDIPNAVYFDYPGMGGSSGGYCPGWGSDWGELPRMDRQPERPRRSTYLRKIASPALDGETSERWKSQLEYSRLRTLLQNPS
jgi:putative ABC transport system permease protein